MMLGSCENLGTRRASCKAVFEVLKIGAVDAWTLFSSLDKAGHSLLAPLWTSLDFTCSLPQCLMSPTGACFGLVCGSCGKDGDHTVNVGEFTERCLWTECS